MSITPCQVCHAPEKTLWTPNIGPNFICVDVGNWIDLEKCPSCDDLWVTVPYEPNSFYIYKAYWKWGRENWDLINAIDNGATLHRWHRAIVCKFGPTLTGEEQECIQRHYTRSYGLEPYANCAPLDLDAPDEIIEEALRLHAST